MQGAQDSSEFSLFIPSSVPNHVPPPIPTPTPPAAMNPEAAKLLLLSSRMSDSGTNKNLCLQLCVREVGNAESWPRIVSIPVYRGTLLFYSAASDVTPDATLNALQELVNQAGLCSPIVSLDDVLGWTDRNGPLPVDVAIHKATPSTLSDSVQTFRVTYNYAKTMKSLNDQTDSSGIVARLRGTLANLACPSLKMGAPVLDAPAHAFQGRGPTPLTLLDLERYHMQRFPILSAPSLLTFTVAQILNVQLPGVPMPTTDYDLTGFVVGHKTTLDACMYLSEGIFHRYDTEASNRTLMNEVRVATFDVGTGCQKRCDLCTAECSGFVVKRDKQCDREPVGGWEQALKASAPEVGPFDFLALIGPSDGYRKAVQKRFENDVNELYRKAALHCDDGDGMDVDTAEKSPAALHLHHPLIVFDYAHTCSVFLTRPWFWISENVPRARVSRGLLDDAKLVRIALDLASDLCADVGQLLNATRMTIAIHLANRILCDGDMIQAHIQLLHNALFKGVGAFRSGGSVLGKRDQREEAQGADADPQSDQPNSADHAATSYKGGHVLKSVNGFFADAVELDFDSHYPSIMAQHELFYKAANPTHTSVLGKLFKGKMVEWIQKKRQLKAIKDRADESLAAKLKLNTFYGCLGRAGSSISNVSLAARTTAHGRALLQALVDAVPKKARVVMGHTDAVMIVGVNDDDVVELCELTNQDLDVGQLRLNRTYRFSWVMNMTHHVSMLASLATAEAAFTALLRASAIMIPTAMGILRDQGVTSVSAPLLEPACWIVRNRFASVVKELQQNFVFPGLINRSLPTAANLMQLLGMLLVLVLRFYERSHDTLALDITEAIAFIDHPSLSDIAIAEQDTTATLSGNHKATAAAAAKKAMFLTLFALDRLFSNYLKEFADWQHWINTPDENIPTTRSQRNDSNYRHYIKSSVSRSTATTQARLPVIRSSTTHGYEPVPFENVTTAHIDTLWWRRRMFETLVKNLDRALDAEAGFKTTVTKILSRLILGKQVHNEDEKKNAARVPVASTTPSLQELRAEHDGLLEWAESVWVGVLTNTPGADARWNALPDADMIARRLVAKEHVAVINTSGVSELAWLENDFAPAVRSAKTGEERQVLKDLFCARFLRRYQFRDALCKRITTREQFDEIWRLDVTMKHAQAFYQVLRSIHASLDKVTF